MACTTGRGAFTGRIRITSVYTYIHTIHSERAAPRSSDGDAVPTFFNTLFVSLEIASPATYPRPASYHSPHHSVNVLLWSVWCFPTHRDRASGEHNRRSRPTLRPLSWFILEKNPRCRRRSVHRHTCRHADDTSCRYIRRLTDRSWFNSVRWILVARGRLRGFARMKRKERVNFQNILCHDTFYRASKRGHFAFTTRRIKRYNFRIKFQRY